KAGAYYVRIGDYQLSGRASNFYRYKVGRFPVITSVYPLGLRRGETREITLYSPGATTKLQVTGQPSPEVEDAVILRPKTGKGKAFNEIKLALGDEPEVESTPNNTSPTAAQQVTLPVT